MEKGGTAGSIIVNAINQIVPGITDPSHSEADRRLMAREANFAGAPLWQQGFWNVLMRVISGEAYQLSRNAGGYNSTLLNWNAADAIPWYLSDFGLSPVYKGFKKGFQIVPLSLAKLFQEAGGEICFNHKLLGFTYDKKTFKLQFEGAEATAQQLVLAMPRRSLDLLAPNSPLLRTDKVKGLTSSVTPQPLFKLFTTYQDPWWRAAGYDDGTGFKPVESGRTVTDLPVRQTYYWPTEEGTPAQSGPAMLMASYDDGVNIGFWDSFRPRRRQAFAQNQEVPEVPQPFESDLPTTESSNAKEEKRWKRYKASQGMVDEVSRQLGTIHGLSYTPKVQEAAFRDWGDDPYGGGWNSWNIGVKSWEVKKDIVQPLEDTPMFICGEAYSDAQGWVEGALQTADMMLEKL